MTLETRSRIREASRILEERSGRGRRYLWTDAFEVCTRVGLARSTGEAIHDVRAQALVDEVHATLGYHRPDDPRTGPLSGFPAEVAARHPTKAGLRIGKLLPERPPTEPFDPDLEWERDGQYFHYLTQWMLALDQLARRARDPKYNRWARELLDTALDAFVVWPPGEGRPRMYWKMSVDLGRPLVTGSGQHDPLDGYVMALRLAATQAALEDPDEGPSVDRARQVLAEMIEPEGLASPDPLGIGALLLDATRLDALDRGGPRDESPLLEAILAAARVGLEAYVKRPRPDAPEARLGFRDLGLAIGLQAVERMIDEPRRGRGAVPRRLEALAEYLPLRDELEGFWLEPAHRRASSWTDHLDINEVTLAACLAPAGLLS